MSLHKGLTQSADLLVQEIKTKLSSGYPSGDSERDLDPIQDTIEIGQVQDLGEGSKSISITLGGEKAPYAVAYEYGSGIHGAKGATYKITPHKASLLRFPVGSPPEGRWPMFSNVGTAISEPGQDVYFEEVDHPGVRAKPFVKPSIVKVAPQITKILGQSFKAEIMSKVERVTVIK